VFANTFDIDGAEAVCADDRLATDAMVDVIAGLTDKSVVMQEGTHAAEYRMLDIYREFGLEQLAAAGGADVWRGRHLDRYAKLARRFEARFVFADGEALFHQLRADHLNIRSALDYALGEDPSHGGPSASDPSPSGPDQREARGTALAIALWAYWRSTGLLVEGRSWISKALEYCPYPSRERARALVARGNLAAMRGLVPDGLSDLREGIALAEQLAQQDVSAIGYLHLNLALTFAEYYDEATEASAEARRRFETLGVPAGLLSVEHMHALLETLSGNPERAVARCAAGLRAAADVDGSVVGNRVRGFLHLSKAFAHQMLGDVRRCRAHAREGLRVHHALGDWFGTALSLEVLCGAAVTSESYDWAAFLLGSSESQWRDTASVLAGATSFTDLHQQMQAATRSALGGRRFDEIYRAGAGTPLDDVVTFALTDFGLTNLSLTGFSLAGLGLTGDGA
jgi:tetratricopeptide (TPR) repeat protein